MSVQQLQEQLDRLTQQAEDYIAELQKFTKENAGTIQSAQKVLGGSNSGVDQEVVSALRDATQELEASQRAIKDTIQHAQSYKNRI